MRLFLGHPELVQFLNAEIKSRKGYFTFLFVNRQLEEGLLIKMIANKFSKSKAVIVIGQIGYNKNSERVR